MENKVLELIKLHTSNLQKNKQTELSLENEQLKLAQKIVKLFAIPDVIGRCFNCKHWKIIKDNTYSKDMGKCNLLSGRWIKDGNEIMGRKYNKEQYHDTETTGIESYTICEHDGAGFTYITKNWFGCVGHNAL